MPARRHPTRSPRPDAAAASHSIIHRRGTGCRVVTDPGATHMQRAPMTKAGSERLRKELERLKSTERPRIIAAIAEARAHGDLSENAEYHAAREQQGFVEGRINMIEAALSTAQVELEDSDSGDTVTYRIVGDIEADIKQGLIAVSSPIARAMIGKNEGDSFGFNAPGGERNYEIVRVSYA